MLWGNKPHSKRNLVMTKKINIFCLLGAHVPNEKWQLELAEYRSNNVCRCKDCDKIVLRSDWLPQLRSDLQKLNRIRLKRKRDRFAASLPLFTTKLTICNASTGSVLGCYRAGMAIYKKDLARLSNSYVIVSARIFGFYYRKEVSGLSLFDKLYTYFDNHPDQEYYTL
jgi:hypothetical protein